MTNATSPMTHIDLLAKRLASGLPSAAMEAAGPALHVHVLDTVGALLAGRATQEGAKIHRLTSAGATAPAVFNASVMDSMAVASATARLTEVDDIHMPSCTTPGSVVILAALALAAEVPPGSLGSPRGFSLASSIHAGYEVMTCLGEALSGPDILHHGVWPTLLLAPVTCAAVASKMLGLDAERTANALAIALHLTNGRPGGSASAGVVAGSGTSARWLLLGMAARSGCAAAFSAARGFSADRTLLDGPVLPALHGITLVPHALEGFLRQDAAVQRTSIKPYCAAKHHVAAIDGFLQLLGQGISHEGLTAIRVRLPPAHARMVGHRDTEGSRLSRITSCAYNLALAGVSPQHLLDIERHAPLRSADVARLASKVEVVADEHLQRLAPQTYPATVELYVGQEMVASKTVVDASGDPKRPFDLPAARVKFRELTKASVDEERAAQVEALCQGLFETDTAPQALWGLLADIESTRRDQQAAELIL